MLTRKLPYFRHNRDVEVMFAIANGELPSRPPQFPSGGNPLYEELWIVCNSCWDEDPPRRPAMSRIVVAIKQCKNENVWPMLSSSSRGCVNPIITSSSYRRSLTYLRRYPRCLRSFNQRNYLAVAFYDSHVFIYEVSTGHELMCARLHLFTYISASADIILDPSRHRLWVSPITPPSPISASAQTIGSWSYELHRPRHHRLS